MEMSDRRSWCTALPSFKTCCSQSNTWHKLPLKKKSWILEYDSKPGTPKNGFLQCCWVTTDPLSGLGGKKSSWSSEPRWDEIILGLPAMACSLVPTWLKRCDLVATWQKCNRGDLSRALWLAEFVESVIRSRPCHFRHGLLTVRVMHQQNDSKTRPTSRQLRRNECCFCFVFVFFFLPFTFKFPSPSVVLILHCKSCCCAQKPLWDYNGI